MSRMRSAAPFNELEFDFLPFRGGLDLVSRPIEVPPGRARDSQNWEVTINDGYVTIKGYERFSGQTKPSAGVYGVLYVTITGSFAVGNTITGATSGATAYVLAVVTDVGANDYLVITAIAGTFSVGGETLNVGGSPQGTTSAGVTLSGAPSLKLHAQYNNLAADYYRGLIAAPTGSGAILGVWMLSDVVYAFRNNAGGTAAGMWKSSASGWTAVALGRELSFTSGGIYVIAEGNTITGATSGATAVITRVLLETGSWAAGTAAGRLIFASDTGTFQSENLNVGANLNVATIAGDSSAITLSPGGRYEFDNYNFGTAKRMYGVDGVNRGFEFDGTVFAPIDTGMTVDTPEHVAAFKNHLFFSFVASVQHSGTGTQYIFTPLFGASEINAGDSVTAFKVQPGVEGGGALAIFSRNVTHVLFGTSTADWNLVRYKESMGAYEYTVEMLVGTILLDDRGVTEFITAQAYGNFQHSALSALVHTWLNARRSLALASCVVRDKNQYRLFFSDDYALYCTFDGQKLLGMMPVLLDFSVKCICSLEASDGDEEIYAGGDDGMVYQMEKGTSFDGGDIDHFLYLHYHHSKSPQLEKAYKSMTLESQGDGYAELDYTYQLGYNSSEYTQPGTGTITFDFDSDPDSSQTTSEVLPAVASAGQSQESSDTTTHDVVIPSGVASGDLLLLLISLDGNTTITAGLSAWTLVQGSASGSGASGYIYKKTADGTETNFTYTTNASERSISRCLRINNVGSAPTITSAIATGTSETPDPPNVDSGNAATKLWLAFCAMDKSVNNLVYPSTFTDNRFTANNGSSGALLGMATLRSGTQTINPGAFNTNQNEEWVAITLAIQGNAPSEVVGVSQWDGTTLFPAKADLGGSAENISLMFSGGSDYFSPVTISGALLRLQKRRQLRGRTT